MEGEAKKLLADMEKYLPFINFLEQLDKTKYKKIMLIRTWILKKTRVQLDILLKAKEVVELQYKNLLVDNVRMPKHFREIFEVEVVDLCSEPEDGNDNDGKDDSSDSDDVQIVSVEPHTNGACALNRRSHIVSEENTQKVDSEVEILNNPPNLSNADDNQLFQRRPKKETDKGESNEQEENKFLNDMKVDELIVYFDDLIRETGVDEKLFKVALEQTKINDSLIGQAKTATNIVAENSLQTCSNQHVGYPPFKFNMKDPRITRRLNALQDLVQIGSDINSWATFNAAYGLLQKQVTQKNHIPQVTPHNFIPQSIQNNYPSQTISKNPIQASSHSVEQFELRKSCPATYKEHRLLKLKKLQAQSEEPREPTNKLLQEQNEDIQQRTDRLVQEQNEDLLQRTDHAIDISGVTNSQHRDETNCTNAQNETLSNLQPKKNLKHMLKDIIEPDSNKLISLLLRGDQSASHMVHTNEVVKNNLKTGEDKTTDTLVEAQSKNKDTSAVDRKNLRKNQQTSQKSKESREMISTSGENDGDEYYLKRGNSKVSAPAVNRKNLRKTQPVSQKTCSVESGEMILSSDENDDNQYFPKKGKSKVSPPAVNRKNLRKNQQTSQKPCSVKRTEMITPSDENDDDEDYSKKLKSRVSPPAVNRRNLRKSQQTPQKTCSVKSTEMISTSSENDDGEDYYKKGKLKVSCIEKPKKRNSQKRKTAKNVKSDEPAHKRPTLEGEKAGSRQSQINKSEMISATQVKEVIDRARAKQCSSKGKAHQTAIKQKNTASEMTLSTKICVLCNAKSEDLTNHYIRRHDSESYVARLTPSSLESLELNTTFAQRLDGSNRVYEVKCIFCGELVQDVFRNFFEHYSSHTGEYAFKCKKCKLNKPFETDIVAHQSRTRCINAGLQLLYQYPENVKVIYLYCCKLCNFVQLNEANTLKHLRDQHNKRQADSTFVRKYLLAAIRDEEDIDDNICVTNEPSVDETNEELSYEVENYLEVVKDEICCEPDYLQIAALPEYQLNAHTIEVNNTQIYRANPGQVEYFGLLKCMAVDCWFSTDKKDEIIEHIEAHLNSECPPEENLQCAYCQFSANECTSFEMLIEHVLSKHKRSRFQCSYCSYRAITAGHVFLHLEKNHETESDRTIFRCNDSTGEDVICMKPDEQLIIENVKKLLCPYTGCTEKYYSLTQLQRHVMKVHQLDVDVDSLQHYSCIYCANDFGSNDDVVQHLIISHPDEPPYVCHRISSDKDKDDSVGNLPVYQVELCSNQESLKITDVNTVPNSCPKNEPEETQDIKFDFQQQLNEINEDIVKKLLIQLTVDTGIAPDQIYQCPVTVCGAFFSIFSLWNRHMKFKHKEIIIGLCPHCAMELEMKDFQKHFESHRRHLSGCFHCGETFPDEHATKDHIALNHKDVTSIRLEKIGVYFTNSFSVLLKEDYTPDRLDFLVELQGVLKKRKQYLEESRNAARKTAWIVPLNTSWIEDFPCFTVNRRNRCPEPKCSALSHNVEELQEHLRTAHPASDLTFTCSKCTFRLYKSSNLEVVNHLKFHINDLYICCVCSHFHYDRHEVYDHIATGHRYRDVPVVKLIRSRECIQISIGVVFVEQRKTFSTTRQCFLCSETSWSNYAVHLKSTHNITLKYHCEVCDHQMKNLGEVDQHFSEAHHSEQYKIRAQFETSNKLSVTSINPLSICIDHDNSFIKPFIKKELDCEQVDDDDIIIANECETNKPTSRAYESVSCVSLQHLQPQTPQTTQRATQLYPALQLALFGTNTLNESVSCVSLQHLQSQTPQTTQQSTQLYPAAPLALCGTNTPNESISRVSFGRLQTQTSQTTQQATQRYPAAPLAICGTNTPNESVSCVSLQHLQSQTPQTTQKSTQLYPAAPLALCGTNTPNESISRVSFGRLQSQTSLTMQQDNQVFPAAPIALYGTNTPTSIVNLSVSPHFQSQTPHTMQQASQLSPVAPLAYGTNLPFFNMGGIMPVTKGNTSRKNSDVP